MLPKDSIMARVPPTTVEGLRCMAAIYRKTGRE